MRKNSLMMMLFVLGIVVAGIAIIDASTKRPIDWTKTYSFKDKIPFGLYVFRQELPHILGEDRKYEDTGKTIYEITEELDSLRNYNKSIIKVDEHFEAYAEDLTYFLKFIKGGGEAFISVNYQNYELIDTLGLEVKELPYESFATSDESVTYSLAGDNKQIKLAKTNDFQVFSKLDSSTTTILGYMHIDGKRFPNFVKIKFGDGVIYLHQAPTVFGNYHMLQKEGYSYASNILNLVKSKDIILIDKYYDWEESMTPLRVLLKNPGFKEAWYLLLIGLVLLFAFRIKREQRAVKVVFPEPNLSKEFAQTIGNLYYENGTPGNIIHKKIDYFLFLVRSTYHLDTLDLEQEKFVKQLSLKSGVAYEEVQKLIQLIVNYKKRQSFAIEDVKTINRVIEDFKLKANIV